MSITYSLGISFFPQVSTAIMISCHTAATARLLPPSKSQSHFKRLKRSPDTPCQSLSKTDIHDLPDSVLVEILCRLPHNKFIFQCQRVCKRWFSLISDEKFHCRFLWLQSHNQKPTPTESTLIFRDAKNKRKYFILPELELPMFRTSDFSLPLFGATDYIETRDDGPIVVGACNDLVLCCGDISYQRDYYICNPYTKQYVRLPPTPRCYREVRVGFICDQYYKEDVDDQKNEGITSSGIIQVDVDFRYAIVRICPRSPFKFNIEIFSSETGKWTESVIQSPQDGFFLDSLEDNGGIAHNGILYWWSVDDHFIIGLDPYSKNHECPRFRLINVPEINGGRFAFLRGCRGGRLRICNFFYHRNFFNHIHPFPDILDVPVDPIPMHPSDLPDTSLPSMSVWELKDDGDNDAEGGGEWCHLTGIISLRTMVFESPLIRQWERPGYHMLTPITVLAFDPNNDDILYLELFGRIIVTCNIRDKRLKEATLISPYESLVDFGRGAFPFVLPRWPTPLPKSRSYPQTIG